MWLPDIYHITQQTVLPEHTHLVNAQDFFFFFCWESYFTKILGTQELKYKTLLKIQISFVCKIIPVSYFAKQKA